MSRKLVELLGGEIAAELALQELRSMTRDSMDVRLIADILHKAHSVMRRLGLDPNDTTPQEVYNSLINSVKNEQWLAILGDTDYVLVDVNGEIISFNPIDVIDNFHFQLPLSQRRVSAARKGLGWEIVQRYHSHPETNNNRVKEVAGRVAWPVEEPNYCRVFFDKPSILVIGDIASESLITIESDQMEITGTKNNRKISLDLGARIACKGGHVYDASGAAANSAIVFSKLGIQPSLMSWLGNDTAGRQSLSYLRQFGIDMSGVSVSPHGRTNYHYVLRSGAERTILASYEKFNYKWLNPVCKPDWIYLSMISEDSEHLHEQLVNYLTKNPEIKLAFQPGASHFSWGAVKLSQVLQLTEIIIMNIDEAMTMTGRKSRDVVALLKSLYKLGAKNVVLTDGPSGSYAYDGQKVFEMPSYPDPSEPVDRTGAGDIFAATLVAEMSKGRALNDAMLRAPINSMSVVQHVGAQSGLLNSKQIEEHLSSAPKDYKLKLKKES